MNTKNLLFGSLAGGVAFFLLGWLIYGMLLMNYMMSIAPYIKGLYRSDEEMLLGVMFLSNICSALLLSIIFDLGNINNWKKGLQYGAIIGILLTCSFDLGSYAMTFMTTKRLMLIDVLASAVMTSAVGAVIGGINGMGAKKSN